MILDSQTISTDTALELVNDPRRRSILTYMIDDQDRVARLDELVEHIDPENPPPESTDVTRRERATIELLHTHLPRLADAGIVEYDERSETIRYHPNERVEKLHRFVTIELE